MNVPSITLARPSSPLPCTIDAAHLDPIVSKALQMPVCVQNWTVDLLTDYAQAVKPNAAGVARVHGTATTSAGEVRDWSLILKLLKSPAGMIMPNGMVISQAMADDRSSFGYWRREAEAYQGGLLSCLPQGLAAPACYGITASGEQICLWQEEAVNSVTWSWSHYRTAAYRLGTWQGSYVTGEQTLPACDWLSHRWLQQWVGLPVDKMVELLDCSGAWEKPLVQTHFSAQEIAQVRRLWGERARQLAYLEQLPQALCHLDAYRANFFWHGDTLTLIDWEFVGAGALGEEMAAFVGATLLLDHVPLAEAAQLEAVALDGYIAGLRAAGWNGDANAVWQAYRCVMPLRYAFLSLASMCRTEMDPEFAAGWSQQMGIPLEAILAHRADFVRFMLGKH